MKELSKWIHTIKNSMTKLMAYRMNFFLQVLVPTIVFFFIKYSLWSTIFKDNQSVGGYNFSQMIEYHAWALIIGILGQGHQSMNLADDIRLGRISTYLIYPFNFWEFHTASFIGFQIVQFITASFAFLSLFALGFIQVIDYLLLLKGVFLILTVGFFWFTWQFLAGLLAFWLEQTWVFRVILLIITNFLSGSIIPIDLFPAWLVKILNYSPFPYLTYGPIKVLMGNNAFFASSFLMLSLWMGVFILINYLIWKKGLRLYTAAGM